MNSGALLLPLHVPLRWRWRWRLRVPLPLRVRVPLLVALACALLPLAGRAERISLPTPAPSALMALQADAEQAVELGYDHADAALAALRALAARPALPAGAERVLALARGLVAAGAGRDAEFGAAVSALHARADREPLAAADALLVQATEAMTQDRAEVAARHATAALNLYTGRCESTLPDADCNLRAVWHTRQMLALYSAGQGKLDIALQHAQAAVELARRADDLGLKARALALAADIKAGQGEQDSARRLFADAERMARLDGDALTQARLKLIETRITEHRGDALGARRAAEQGLGWARLADSPRLAGRLLTNLSDSYLKAGQARHALDAVEQALPLVRRYGERRTERVLLANRALARVALHMGASARAEMEPVLSVFAASDADAELAALLREFADALANAGDLHGALELFHRERELVARTMARNREATLATLRERFDREAQQRDIELHSRENALRAAELANQASARQLWLEVAVTAALAALVVALLYGRVRHINRRLAHNQARLRVQSEHDALTGLANRRRLHTLVQQRGASENFNGALLLVDIDHFKHINDEHGHAAGDVVLVEVARRLLQVVRDGDVVVRWGGEEFLIFAPEVSAAQVQALATRVLQSVGGQAVAAGALNVAVTASVGYGSFSPPPHHPAMTLERAVNLVDMALYTAKNQGRNRAVGITRVNAADAAALAAVESDFDLAWQQGRVTLDRIAGPTAAERAVALPA